MDYPALIIELGFRVANPVFTIRKPFNVLAEGLISESSRDDKTAIELFVAGVRSWGTRLR